jgi:anti-anti-sigma factor
MEIKKTEIGTNEAVLALAGRLDTLTAAQLQPALVGLLEAGSNVTLDFEKLDYMSSAGLRVLLIGEKTAEKSGLSMKIHNVSATVMEVFDMTGFSDILTIV